MSHDWEALFQERTQIRIEEGGQIAANSVFETPQTIEIVDTSSATDEDGDWPQAVTLRGTTKLDEEIAEIRIDNIHVRKGIERGDAPFNNWSFACSKIRRSSGRVAKDE